MNCRNNCDIWKSDEVECQTRNKLKFAITRTDPIKIKFCPNCGAEVIKNSYFEIEKCINNIRNCVNDLKRIRRSFK